MQEKDLEEVAAVDVATFNHWWKNERGKDLTLLPRALPLLRLYQGRGIARKMIAEVLEHLTGAGAKTITLETMPESVKNLGLYASLGFRPYGLRLRLSKFPFEEKRPQDTGLEFIPIDDPSLFGDVVTLSGLAFPGLDCARTIFLNAKHALGKSALICRRGRPVGFVILQLVGRRGEVGESYLKVLVLAREEEGDGFRAVIHWCEENAVGKLTIPVYSAYWHICQELCASGYSIVNSGVRMFYHGYKESYSQEKPLLLCEWAG